ncbi:EamA family transporter [Burkholderia perseverans]|uniref:EamA family transporter n=1 Tax=Burkholderia perseverans TaxID=2615214 RepID=UPI001FEF1A8D|nr:EamA family transporter [Burkholderia perseverans]
MKIRDLALALLVTALWGINFSVIKIGLGSFDPFLLAALRFVFCALPWVLVFKRPTVPFKYVFWYGLILGALQFGLLFLGIREGLTAGLASVVLQLQVFFTICFGAIALRERVKVRQLAGMVLAFIGVVAIAKVGGGASNLLAVLLVVGAAASWGVANIIVKKSGATDMLGFMVWSSLVPPLPLFAVALAVNGPAHVAADLRNIGWSGAGAVAYLVYPTTLFGYSIWNILLRKYKTSLVAPLTLLVPIFGMLSSMVIFHEELTVTKVVAVVFVIAGLLINLFGLPFGRRAAAAAPQTTPR